MRCSTLILGAFCAAPFVFAVTACGDDDDGGAGGAGRGTTATSATSGTSTSSTTTTTSTGMAAPCAPGAECTADPECLGLVDNTGKTKFGLRISELDLSSPPALTRGIVELAIAGNAAPNLSTCNVLGTGTFSWLIQFDTEAGTLKTGGAKPVADPTRGYAFVDETITQGTTSFHIQPVTYQAKPDANGSFSIAMGADLVVPIYLDAQGSTVLLLPLHDAKFDMGTLSMSQNCIGHYNVEGLDPGNSCLPDDRHPAFITNASLSGRILLEEADNVLFDSLGQSLCVLLSGDAAMYGDGGRPIAKCKRTNGEIAFQGDSCSMPGGTCKDSVTIAAQFAASSVNITN